MGRQLWLADVLRSAGLTVHEVSGWKTRGTTDFEPRGLIVHETMGSKTSSDTGEINVMINGREGLDGPIAHVYLSRSGAWHVVTSGFSHHVKTGWGGPFSGLGNRSLLGIEAQHSVGEPWTATQYQSYVTGVAAILAHTGWKVAGHKEHQPSDKSDPQFDMAVFRRDVAAVLSGADMDLNLAQLVPIDVNPDGTNKMVSLGQYLRTIAIRTNYIGNVFSQELRTRLDAILAAAQDDGNTTVVLDPSALEELQAIRAELAASEERTRAIVREEIDKTKLGAA